MKVKIYVNRDRYSVDENFPRILTKKQYQEKLEELVKDRMENLVDDDGFGDHLACDYSVSEIFFFTEEEKQNIIKDFKPYVIDTARNEMQDYYEEHEIEI